MSPFYEDDDDDDDDENELEKSVAEPEIGGGVLLEGGRNIRPRR